jgi:dTDP-4-dehydrorhamnose reductase
MIGETTRILVLGATGMLGHEAIRVMGDRFEVHATARDPGKVHHTDLVSDVYAFDASHPERLAGLLQQTDPAVVLNCIGIVKQLDEASRPVPSITVNSLLPHLVAEACSAHGARLIHVSTDCVFSGRLEHPGRYTEADVPDPVDLYGRSKLLGEVTTPGALTLRTSIIGWELGRRSGLLEWLASEAGGTIRGFANAWFSGLTTTALSRVIASVIEENRSLSGLYHVSSEPISKLDLVSRLNQALELGCEIEPADEPRVNRALDSSRFREATGIEIPSWDEMIGEYAKEREHAQSR